MAKLLNAVFGVGVGVVVYVLVLLGIQAFYPEIRYDDFCNSSLVAPVSGFDKCFDNMTVGECRASYSMKENDDYRKCNDAFTSAEKNHNVVFFVVSSIIGLAVVLIGFFLVKVFPNISAGLVCSGIVLVLHAFIRGWISVGDKTKFVAGLVVAAIVIFLAVRVNRMLAKKE